MDAKLILPFILISCIFPLLVADDVQVTIKAATLIARTDDNFVCATLDWWPSTKCNYNQCPWGQAGLTNLDLTNKILSNAVKAFNPLRLRVGGSLQDQLIFKVGNTPKKCPSFKRRNNGLFGFSRGCLQTERWDRLNYFFNQTGALVTFGVNALYGRKQSQVEKGLWIGDWNSQNARDLIEYTRTKGYKIDSYEFGNELCGSGIEARVEADQYGKDVIALKKLVEEIYQNASSRPKIVGPGGFYNEKWFATFLQVTGPNVLDGLTHHIYNLGAGVDSSLLNRVQDPFFLSKVAQTYKDVSNTVKRFGPWTGAWVGESGGAYNSGSKNVSSSFADGFWYLDQFGMTSTFNHKVFCRQTFIGGNYGLLNTTTFVPNPDYYGALLWHRLMGKEVLSTTHQGSPYLRVYSHCAKRKPGITLLLINMARSTSFNITLINDENMYLNSLIKDSSPKSGFKGYQQRDEYHLTPKDGNILSDVVLLNGTPLQLTKSLDIPPMRPKLVDGSSPITVVADSIVFVRIKDFHAPACA